MRLSESTACRVGRLAAAGIGVLAAVVLPLEASAGSCEKTRRAYSFTESSIEYNAHTTAHNDSGGNSYRVTIYRGSTEKASKTLVPGDMVGQFAGFGTKGNDDFTEFKVLIGVPGKTASVTCTFQIMYGERAVWDLAPGATSACGDATALCPTCKVSCDKSYHPDKQRWNTTFRVTD